MEKLPKIEQEEKNENIATEKQLQEYLNGTTLDIPKDRRDLNIPENISWLERNIYLKNYVPEKYMRALTRLYEESRKRK